MSPFNDPWALAGGNGTIYFTETANYYAHVLAKYTEGCVLAPGKGGPRESQLPY